MASALRSARSAAVSSSSNLTSVRFARCMPPVAAPSRSATRQVLARAAESQDFDAFLIKIADKFEKAENKPIVIAYGVGAVVTILTAEWFIHLPLLEFLLGFPVQLLGLLLLPYLGVRYFLEGGDAAKDAEEYTALIVSKLPGLKK